MIRQIISSGLAALMLMTGWPEFARGQQQQACFAGNDHTGGPARLFDASNLGGRFGYLFTA